MLYVKPHIKLGTIVIMSSNEVTQAESAVPAWMRKASTGASIGNIDASDLKPPQLKMLAGTSPEVINGTPGATPGNFWMTMVNQPLGKECSGSMILLRKSYQIWAPRGVGIQSEQKGPLASATNGLSWDIPNQTFDIRLPNNPKPITWKIGRLVTDYGATKWGSSNPDDPKSKPIATLTYNMLWLIDMPHGPKQLCVLIAARTMVEPTKNFITSMKMIGVDHYYQRYRLVSQKRTGPTGDPFFVYEYQHTGVVQNEADGEYLKSLYDNYVKSGFVVDLAGEADDIQAEKTAAAGPVHMANNDEEIDSIPF